MILILTVLLQISFHFVADPCYHYRNLSDASRKITNVTPYSLCDNKLPEGWYRFVGAAGKKMPTTRVPAFSCGTFWSGWLDDAHPSVEDGEVRRKVCFSARHSGCKGLKIIYVKNCGPYFIYKLRAVPICATRYCGTD